MISISVNNEFISLSKKGSIRLEKNFQTLELSIFQGDYTFPFDIPADETNFRIFGFVNDIANPNKKIKYDCFIYISDIPWAKGSINIVGNTSKTIKINIIGGVKAMYSSGKSLKELDFGPPIYLGKFPADIALTATNISNEASYNVHGYTFVPHQNSGFYGDGNTAFMGVLNMVNPNTGLLYHNTISTGNKYSLVPFLYLHFIMQKIFDFEGLVPRGSFWDNQEMQSILLYNNYALDSLNEIGPACVKTTTAVDYYQANFVGGGGAPLTRKTDFIKGPPGTFDEPFAYSNANNEYEITTTGLYTMVFEGNIMLYLSNANGSIFGVGFFIGTNYIAANGNGQTGFENTPITKITATFSAGLSDIGKKISFKFFHFYPPMGPVTTNKWCSLGPSKITYSQSNNTGLNMYSRFVDLKNHVKDIEIDQFLLAVKQLGVKFTFDYNNKFVSVDFADDIFQNSSALDWTQKAVTDFEVNYDNYKKGYRINYDFGTVDKLATDNFLPVDPYRTQGEVATFQELPTTTVTGLLFYVQNMNQYFISSYDQYASPQYFWKKYTDYYVEQTVGSGDNEVKLKFSPMLMAMGKNTDPSGDPDKEMALMPASLNQGSSEMFNTGTNDYDLKICFYRGINQTKSAPYNKGGIYHYAGTTIKGLNGNIVGDFDLTFHLPTGFWLKFLINMYLKISTGESYEQDFRLNDLDLHSISEAEKIHVDGVNFITKSISLMIEDKLRLARATMIRI